MSVFRFIRHVADDEPLVLFGDGNQQRDFTYIDDIARGTIAALKPVGYEIINLGAGRPVAVSTLIERISQLLDRNARINTQPAHKADVFRTWADVAKARSYLDWEPRVSLDKGLARAVDWYHAHRDLASSIELGDR
jgi:nucleoside-diphosphate-sugar epimerase